MSKLKAEPQMKQTKQLFFQLFVDIMKDIKEEYENIKQDLQLASEDRRGTIFVIKHQEK